ncbi:hypothetical protein [Modestobacter lacusdianchii]
MPSGQPPVVEPWLAEALKTALRDAGCPSDIAEQLSAEMRVERPRGTTEWLLMLFNHGTSYPDDREDVVYAAEHLAVNMAADNAEAVDRTARGDPGWSPYWPLSDRAPRRQ